MTESHTPDLECVDPTTGESILELSRSGLDSRVRTLLEAHLEVCAYCRQTVDLERRLATSPRHRRSARVRPSWWAGAALATAAASAFCMMSLAPRPIGPTVSLRGPDDARFVRPVEGEVVLGSGSSEFSARWTEVAGADSYELKLSEVDGSGSWTASTLEPYWQAGDDLRLTPGKTYRLVLSTVPADLVPPGEASVRFVAGRTSAMIVHRARRAQPVAYFLFVAALILGFHAVRSKRRA